LNGTVLVALAGPDDNVLLASRNVPCVELVTGGNLNTYQVLRYDKLLFTRGALAQVEQRLSQKA